MRSQEEKEINGGGGRVMIVVGGAVSMGPTHPLLFFICGADSHFHESFILIVILKYSFSYSN